MEKIVRDKTITLDLSREEFDQLEQAARASGVTRSALLRQMIREVAKEGKTT